MTPFEVKDGTKRLTEPARDLDVQAPDGRPVDEVLREQLDKVFSEPGETQLRAGQYTEQDLRDMPLSRFNALR